MAVINNQYLEPLRISIYGKSKVGKTTLAAGIPGCHVLNFANVEVEDLQKVTIKAHGGDSFVACEKLADAGKFDMNNYHYIVNWNDYKATVGKIVKSLPKRESSDPRPWIIYDDTTNFRMMARVQYEDEKNKVPGKMQWGLISQDQIKTLNFVNEHLNIILVHETKDEYVGGEATGNTIPAYFPNVAEATYQAKIFGEIFIENRKRYFRVDGMAYGDYCDPSFDPVIENPDMLEIFRRCELPKKFWPKSWAELKDPVMI